MCIQNLKNIHLKKNYNWKNDFLKRFLKKDKNNIIFFKKRKKTIYFDLPNYIKSQLKFNKITNIDHINIDTFDKKKDNIEEMIETYNLKYKIKEINNIDKFELKSFNLRSYFHNNILAFGDLLHRIHPLAGQGFNMTIRDIKILTKIISNKKELGLPLDSLINDEFEKIVKHRNLIFSSGIDFVHEFFNLERKVKNNILSKSIQLVGNNHLIKKVFTKIADKGILL